MKTIECEWCETVTPKTRKHGWIIVDNETLTKELYWLCNACHSYGTGVNSLDAYNNARGKPSWKK